MDLVGVLGGTTLNEVVVERIVLVLADGLELGSAQLNLIQLAVGEHLVGDVDGLDHLDRHGVKQLHGILVDVALVLGQNLLVLVDVVGDGVRAIVPHGLVGGAKVAVHADFGDQVRAQRSQAVVGSHGREVGQLVHAVIDQRVVVGRFNANHLKELIQAQRLGGVFAFGLRQFLGVVVVVRRAGDHLDGHRGVGRLVLGVVQNPLQTGEPVFGRAVCHVLALVVNPGDAFLQVEHPGLAAVGRGEILRGRGNQLTLAVVGEQVLVAVAQNVQVNGCLRIMVAERFHFSGLRLIVAEVLDLFCGSEIHAAEDQSQHQHERQSLLHVEPSFESSGRAAFIFSSPAVQQLRILYGRALHLSIVNCNFHI